MPRTWPVCVTGPPSARRAMPKSPTREPLAVVEQQVAGLDVAVHDAASCAASSAAPASRSQRRPCRASIARPRLEPVGDGAAAQQLHDDERPARVLADVVDRHHVRVRGEPGGGPRLALEALARARRPRRVRGEHLDRHGAVEQLVVRLPDAGHPAVGDVAGPRGSGRAARCGAVTRAHAVHGTHRPGVLYFRVAWPVSVTPAESARPSARAAPTRWSRRSAVSTRTSRRSASARRAPRSASTSARAA